MTSHPSTVTPATIAFLCGLCEVEELPSSFIGEILGALGMSASGTRSHLARALADGRLCSRRDGRRTSYRLSGSYLRRYRTIRNRFGEQPDWQGHFQIVIYDIPETRRTERDALRSAAFDEGWASPRPGVLLGMRPAGPWADSPACCTGLLKVDLDTARDLAARAWPLAEAAERISALAAYLDQIHEHQDTGAADDSRPALLRQVVTAHAILSKATHLWGSLPALPADLLPADYPHDLLARIDSEISGPLMASGARAASRLLAEHQAT